MTLCLISFIMVTTNAFHLTSLWSKHLHHSKSLIAPSSPFIHLTKSKVMVLVWRVSALFYIGNVLPLQWAQLIETVYTARLCLEFVFLCFLGWMIYLYICTFCFTLDSWVISFIFWRWHNELNWAPFEFFAPSPLLRVKIWLHPFKGHCEEKPMWDEGFFYVAGHLLLNRKSTRLPGSFNFPKRILNHNL